MSFLHTSGQINDIFLSPMKIKDENVISNNLSDVLKNLTFNILCFYDTVDV